VVWNAGLWGELQINPCPELLGGEQLFFTILVNQAVGKICFGAETFVFASGRFFACINRQDEELKLCR
jgi:hypothetical protein